MNDLDLCLEVVSR